MIPGINTEDHLVVAAGKVPETAETRRVLRR